jgi:AcrR family transcriptional regulator
MNEASSARRRAPRADGLATQRKVLDAATTMFAASGYEATSLRQIAAAADIDLATLKYHFTDKVTLFAEVYRHGHAAFFEVMTPFLDSLDTIHSPDALRLHLRHIIHRAHDFFLDHFPFVRLVLYRLLEDNTETISVEDELQGIALTLIERAFQTLIERGVVRAVDVRALIVMMISGFSMWAVTCEVKPRWIGEPHPNPATEAGRARSEDFLYDVLVRLLLP